MIDNQTKETAKNLLKEYEQEPNSRETINNILDFLQEVATD